MNGRPTYRELNNKLKKAKEAVANGNILLINPDALVVDAIELNILVKELPKILQEVLDETKPGNYVGQHPPARSYEDRIKGEELFAFKIDSKRLGCDVYLKFALFSDLIGQVSLHEDRREEGG